MSDLVLFAIGLAVVVVGAELVLRGGTQVALIFRIPPIVIGLTVVSIGTSTPELAVGITAANQGHGPLALGNIAGTNIVNILLILGLSALIRPLPTRSDSVKLDVPVMIGSAFALILMCADGELTRTEGLLMLSGAVVYTVALVSLSRRQGLAMREEFAQAFGPQTPRDGTTTRNLAWHGGMLIAGMMLCVLGAQWLVEGASAIARAQGVSDAFIGLTIVAIGTSAPELVTTLLATIRNERDVAIGNLIGSSVYNILAILGLTALLASRPLEVTDEILLVDLPLAAIVALVCLPVFRTDRRVSRPEGAAFVLAYLAYLTSLIVLRT